MGYKTGFKGNHDFNDVIIQDSHVHVHVHVLLLHRYPSLQRRNRNQGYVRCTVDVQPSQQLQNFPRGCGSLQHPG